MKDVIDLSDLSTDGLDLEHPETFQMYRDAFVEKLYRNDNDCTEGILLDLSLTDSYDDFLEVVNELDNFYQSKNIHFITCL